MALPSSARAFVRVALPLRSQPPNVRLYRSIAQDTLHRIADHPARHIAELLTWNWKRASITAAA